MKYIFSLVLSAFFYENACADADIITKEASSTKATHLVQSNPDEIFYQDLGCLQEWVNKNRSLASYALDKGTLDFITTANIDDAIEVAFTHVASTGLKVMMGFAMASTIVFVPEDLMASALSNIHQTFSGYIENPALKKSAGTFVTTFIEKMTEWAKKTVASKAISNFKEGWNSAEDQTSQSTVSRFGKSCKGLWSSFKQTVVKTVRSTVSSIAPSYVQIRTLFV